MPLVRGDEHAPPAGGGQCTTSDYALRRGSVPVDVARHRFEDDAHLEASVPPPAADQPFTLWHYQRRGSAPTDLPPLGAAGERRELLTRHTSLNGKRRKKQLRRRSSGGPETVCIGLEPNADSLSRLLMQKNDVPDTLLARRRGSLPIEVLTVGHSGNAKFLSPGYPLMIANLLFYFLLSSILTVATSAYLGAWTSPSKVQ